MPTPIGALLLLLLLLSTATDTVSAIDTNCQSVPDGYSTKIGTRCSQYVYCQRGLLTSTFTCPDGLLYNGQYCDWADTVDCALDDPSSGGTLVTTAAIDPATTTTATTAAATTTITTAAVLNAVMTTTPPSSTFATPTTTSEALLCATSMEELQTSCAKAASCSSIQCPSGMFCFSFKCAGAIEGVNSDATMDETILIPTSSNERAMELASNLYVMMEMQENFNHDADCSMADWTLCYTQNLLLDYWGDGDYMNK